MADKFVKWFGIFVGILFAFTLVVTTVYILGETAVPALKNLVIWGLGG